QAEDGIRDRNVTGVQTCALPISTLVREDRREDDVFSLIGPKRYDAPWRDLEAQGWIAPAVCTEIRVGFPDWLRIEYAVAEPNEQIGRASCRGRGEEAGGRG